MNSQLRGRAKALLAFVVIAALVIGGLGWVTTETLRLEQAQVQADAERELSAQLSLALWRLDGRIAPALAKEDSRPYDHYGAFFAPAVLFRNDGSPLKPGDVVEPSPLVSAELPSWMLLHFQTDVEVGWGSPQVLSQNLRHILDNPKVKAPLDNVTTERQRLLIDMAGCWGPQTVMKQVEMRCAQLKSQETTVVPNDAPAQPVPQQEAAANPQQAQNNYRNVNPGRNSTYNNEQDAQTRSQLQKRVKDEAAQNKAQTADLGVALSNTKLNGESWFVCGPIRSASQKAEVKLGPMVPLWLTPEGQEERLVVARTVKIGEKQVCQGIVLDWPRLQTALIDECSVHDLFPEGRLVPMREATPPHPERTMRWLPVELDPGSVETSAVADWTPLRVGLALAWAAALVALAAVGLGGSMLLALSERRIRFVSAVTHELRTPLTTLRLYLDMLTGGMVQDEQQKTEYLHTLNGETDRLNRLVSNVLDFARLERQRPRLDRNTVAPTALLEQVSADWQERCRGADKELIVENQLPEDAQVTTDVKLVEQILGNLIDNACKYSRGADDRRVWLRARREGKRLVLEVEDCGPGVPVRERGGIFRAFRRGRDADVTAGGVGLGLALARQWARLLGGRLVLGNAKECSGACFRVELPLG